MNLDSERYFFLSGLVTFLLLAALIGLFILKLDTKTTIEPFAMLQSDVISVSLDSMDTSAITPINSSNEVPLEKESEAPEIESQQIESEVLTQKNIPKETIPAIDDLFSSVTSPKVIQKQKENLQKQVNELNDLEEKVLASKRDSHFLDKVKKVDIAKAGVKVIAPSTGPQVNEYNAKIQGIIYANFQPPAGTQGSVARIRITLSRDGTLILYRVLSYSSNAGFNGQVDWLKERLGRVELPQNPLDHESIFGIILTAKE